MPINVWDAITSLINRGPINTSQDIKLDGASRYDREIRTYLLDDEFNKQALPAGAVNGTLATPGPGTRTDPNNNTSVGSGVLLINSTTDIEYFADAVTRGAGVLYVAQITAAASTAMDVVSIGFDDAKTAAPDRCAIQFAASDVLNVVEDGTAVAVGSYAGQTTITVAFSLRATGAYFHVKMGAGAWTLYKIGNVNSTATLYAGIGGSGGAPAVSVAWHRVPARKWSGTPTLYDTFASDGATGATATTGPESQPCTARTWPGGATWTVSGGKLLNTPTLGAELLTNGNFAAWTADNPDSWTISGEAGTSEISEVGTGEGHGGVGTGMCNIYKSDGNYPTLSQVILTIGQWCTVTLTVDTAVSGLMRVSCAAGGGLLTDFSSTGSKQIVGRATHAQLNVFGLADPTDLTIDDVSAKAFTLSELLNIPDLGVADVVAEIEIAVNPAGTQAGLAIGWDSQASPANGILAYTDGTNVNIDKNVAGTWTAVQSTATAFSANALLKCHRDGSSVEVFYNDAKVGATQMISDAAIVAGTRHGAFSTNATPTMDNVLIMPRKTTYDGALNRYSGARP